MIRFFLENCTSMSLVETKYNQAIDEMSGSERVARTLSLYDSAKEMLSLQVMRDFSPLSEREKKIKIAECLYLSDKAALELLKIAGRR